MVSSAADDRAYVDNRAYAHETREPGLVWLYGIGAGAARYAPLPLRLMLGFGFIYHGWPKVFDAAGHAAFVGSLTEMGVPLAGLAAWGVGLVEVVGGLALILGAFTGLASLLLLLDMGTAALLVHADKGFGVSQGGVELTFLYGAGLLALLLTGAGPLSIDENTRRPKPGPVRPSDEPLGGS